MDKKTTLTPCIGLGDHAGCIHTTHVEDGKITKVEPTTYPDGEKKVICLKGRAGARLPYNPERLQHPLKRVGKRGEGKWERISWEKALDEIADKMIDIRTKLSPESILFIPHFNSAPYSATQMLLGHRLSNLLEATGWFVGHAFDSSPLLSDFFTYGVVKATNMDPKVLVEGKPKLMIVWGFNPANRTYNFWKYIRQAQKSGAKLVDIGLFNDATARAADWFIQVNPGSDGALALAMVHVIINEGLYDGDYVTRYTNGPFLVRTDNGKLLRESDISADGSSENYVVWDSENNRAYRVAPHTNEPAGGRPALTGTYEPEGIECKPAFQMLVDLAEKNSPEKVKETTGVSPDTVDQLAREYAAAKPAAICINYGLRYMNSVHAHRVMNILSAITGNIGTMGGGTILGGVTTDQFNAPLLRLNDEAVTKPTEAIQKGIPLAQVFECMTTGKPYPIKAMISYCFNGVNQWPNRKRWIEEVFPNLDLIVVNDIFMTATAEYADYVLPDCTMFERDDIGLGYDHHILWLERAIEPMYDCRPPIYFFTELAKRLGFGEYFDKTLEEWIAVRFDSDDPSVAGMEPPLTLERLKKEKIIRANVPDGPFYPWAAKQFPTPSGRLEFYNEELLAADYALPEFREQLESPRSALAEKYPLVFNTSNSKYFIHSALANDAKMLEKYGMTEPHVYINSLDAENRNLSSEDVVVIYNDRGSCKVRVMISDMVPPGVVNLPHGWWPKQYIEGHCQNLIPSITSLEFRNKCREIQYEEGIKRPRLKKTWVNYNIGSSFSPDITFDCLCEVKKAE